MLSLHLIISVLLSSELFQLRSKSNNQLANIQEAEESSETPESQHLTFKVNITSSQRERRKEKGVEVLRLMDLAVLMVLFVCIETELAENIWLVMVGQEGGEGSRDSAI